MRDKTRALLAERPNALPANARNSSPSARRICFINFVVLFAIMPEYTPAKSNYLIGKIEKDIKDIKDCPFSTFQKIAKSPLAFILSWN